LYADDIVLTSNNLNDIRTALVKTDEYLSLCNLKLNLEKCKIIKFRNKGKGRYRKDDKLFLNGHKIDFVSEFCYLGVVFQASGVSFAKHIDKRVKASIFAMSKLNCLPQSSLQAALKLFDLAISPVASYGIEAIWPYLNKNELLKLETVKSRFLKRVLSLSKYTKSRFVYELAETDLLVHDLQNKYSLPDTTEYDKFMLQKLITFSEIDPQFYETPAMLDPSWKEINCKDRHLFTRYACHGFHYLLCKNKSYHWCAKDNCECEKCGEKIGLYHLFECKTKSLTLSQAAKLKL
jgi:Reverse transcriptase (RNA-dependent DNA polymerase)